VNEELEAIRAKLRELGLPHDGWLPTDDGPRKSPIVERQREALTQLKGLLERQVAEDKEKLADLHATVQRLKHGGGV
jgi:hypothetical protein